MQGEQCRQVVGQMVLASPSPAHRDRTFGSIKDDRQLLQVQPRRVGLNSASNFWMYRETLCGDVVEDRGKAFVAVISADLLLKLLHFVA
jgi:hypothetical protein